MADESRVAAGKRFSRDMRLIREDRDTSLEGIHTETRIARSLIESFEEGGLYDHPTFNEVYLRSFVRAYAEMIGIPPKVALEGLDSALEGDYENELAERYLGTAASESLPDADEGRASSSPSSPDPDENDGPSPPVAGGPEGRGGIVGPPRAVGAEEDPDEPSEPVSEEAADSPPASDASEEPPGEDDTAPDAPDAVDESVGTAEEAPSPDDEPADDDRTSETSDAEDEDVDRTEAADQTDDAEEIDDAGEADDAPDDSSEPDPDASDDEEDPAADEETGAESSASDDRPAWFEEQPDEEEDASAQPQPAPAASPAEHSAEESADLEGTGIVGEPTAVGEGATDPAPEAEAPAAAGTPRRSSREAGWRRFFTGARREMVWAGVGMVVILLVLAGLAVAYFSAQEPQTEPDRTAAPPDTAATSTPDTSRAPERPPPADVRLGDTLYLTVVATADVSGIRIQRDDDLRRPYWIEEGDVSVFPFREELMIENELNNVRLFLEGYPYPFSATDTTAEVVITRSRAAAFVDTLRGAPTRFTAQPDTIPVGAPAQQ
jgi:hypothetical protein